MVRIVLLRLLESYFRHRWLLLLPMIIAVATGGFFVANAPPEYVATGRLYVEKESLLASLTSTSNDGDWWVSPAQSTTSEINELIASQAFTRSAIQKTALEPNMAAGPAMVEETFSYFREAVSVYPVGDKLVAISATSDDPQLAYDLVVATMDAYVQWKINSDFQESVTARTFFEAQIPPYQEAVEKARAELIAYLNRYPLPVRGDRPPQEQLEVDRLQAAVENAEERLLSAQDNEESARLALAQSESVTRQTYLVIDQPELPMQPEISITKLLKEIAIFVAAGIFLSAAGIGAGALIDRSLRFPIDVQHGLGLPVLAMVARGKALPPPEPAPIAAAEQPATDEAPAAEPTVLQPQL